MGRVRDDSHAARCARRIGPARRTKRTPPGGPSLPAEQHAPDLLTRDRILGGDRQVVPEEWTLEMTAPRYTWHERYGAQSGVTYGYLWWVADAAPVPAYFAWGFGGQFVYVVPSRQLVVVTATEWQGLGSDASTNALQLAGDVLGVVVNDVVAAAGQE